MDKNAFCWSDAWLLISVDLASKDHVAELCDVIAWGDAVNHAIFSDSELRYGFSRLFTADWITVVKERYGTSKRYNAEIRPKLPDSSTYFNRIEIIERTLNSENLEVNELVRNESKFVYLTSQFVHEAHERYLRSHPKPYAK